MRYHQYNNYKTINIYFSDLKKEAQKEVLKLYQLKDEKEANWDIVPLFVLENQLKEEKVGK